MEPGVSASVEKTSPAGPPGHSQGWQMAEWFCWTVVVLAPLLRWIHGPAVSTDQLVVRIALVCLALVGAVTLRTLAIVRGVKHRRHPSQSSSV